MGNVIKINACVYTRLGYGRKGNTNDFYLNGKFMSDQHLENVQALLESRGNEYFFALADNMEVSSEADANMSFLKEMARYHEKITVNDGDLDFKLNELASRTGDAVRLSTSIMDMNHVPAESKLRDLGFAAVLLTDGQMVAATAGSARAFMMRGDRFEAIARESNKTQRLVNMGVITEEEAATVLEDTLEALKSKDQDESESESLVILSKPLELEEDDKYLLVSQAVLEALGEERLEDILVMRSNSNYIAGKIVSEAMKRSSSGDLTAMVIMVEKVYDGGGSKKPNFKSRIDALHKVPTVSFKYAKKSGGRFEGGAFLVLVLLTASVLIWIVYIIINSMIGGDEKPVKTPAPTVIASIAPTPLPTVETTISPELTPSPTPSVTVQVHEVISGDTLNKILLKYYDDISVLDAFMKFNNISNANSLQIGQKLKIPPISTLK